MPRLHALAAAIAVLAIAGAARAERRHEGLYLRIGVGPGYSWGKLFTAADSNSHGADIATELAVGTSLRPGLVVGVGTFPMIVPSPSYDGIRAGGQHVSATGPFVDYYLDPGGRLHVQGGVLFTAGYLDGSPDRQGKVGLGYGATAGIGYDRYVADKWSLGGLVRVTAYRLYGVDDSIRIVSPAALLTLTRQ